MTQPPPAQDPLGDAIAAVSRAITEIVQSDEGCRFSRVTELCAIGKGLLRMKAKTVEDFEALENPEPNGMAQGGLNPNYGAGVIAPYVPMPPRGRNRVHVQNGAVINGAGIYGGNDPHEVERGLALAMGAEGPIGAALNAREREAEASELRHLIEVSRERPRKEIEDRIQRILKDMEKRNEQADNLVHPELLRGHSPGDDLAEPDAVARVRPDANGACGDDAAPRAGAQIVLDHAMAMVYGG